MRQVVLIRIASDPIARVCSAVAPIIIPADDVEDEDARYLGGGKLVSVPDIQTLLNGAYQRLDITVSGVSVRTLELALEEAASVKGAAVHLGVAYQDDAWQIVGVEWVAQLRADSLTVASQDKRPGRSRSISLSIATEQTDKDIAPLAFFTDSDQRRRSPSDAVFDHVAGMAAGTSRRFGPDS